MKLDVSAYEALHLDGHQADASLYYAKACREQGMLTSLDGGAVRAIPRRCLAISTSPWWPRLFARN